MEVNLKKKKKARGKNGERTIEQCGKLSPSACTACYKGIECAKMIDPTSCK